MQNWLIRIQESIYVDSGSTTIPSMGVHQKLMLVETRGGYSNISEDIVCPMRKSHSSYDSNSDLSLASLDEHKSAGSGVLRYAETVNDLDSYASVMYTKKGRAILPFLS